jgi:acetate kinase
MSLNEIEDILNHRSGLLGLSGISNDTRILAERVAEDRSRLALEVFSYRMRKYVGAYLAALDGADAVVFSGGIGENTPIVRSYVCDGLKWCGLQLDLDLNERTLAGDVRISAPESRIHAWVIHSDEALMLAQEAMLAHEAVNSQASS